MATHSTSSPEWLPTACILCEANCGIEVQLGGDDGRRFTRIRGDKAHPISQGYACEKPSRLDHYQNGGDRITAPLRRRKDGTYEEIDWETAIREVSTKLVAIKDSHGGDSIFYYGGIAQGNHLPVVYSRSTLSALGSTFRSNPIAQEKLGEIFVLTEMTGTYMRSDFEECQVGMFIGKNPWITHGMPQARVTLRNISRDPERSLIVVDPRRSETADFADIHLQLQPGTDAWLLSALLATIVQEKLYDEGWIREQTTGREDVFPRFASVDISAYARICGVPEELIREAARTIATAKSFAAAEDLGVQMNRHSTLVSYLHYLLKFVTGHLGREGCAYVPTPFFPLSGNAMGKPASPASSTSEVRTPVTQSRVIAGLTPCNAIVDEILSDDESRFRAMIVESSNPVHSLADSTRVREAMRSLEFSVVIDIAMTETAREADYVLPVATQFEKAEATFFNFEFPNNAFHLRQPLLEPLDGVFSEAELHTRLVESMGLIPDEVIEELRNAWDLGRPAFRLKFFSRVASDPALLGLAPAILFRAIADKLPSGRAEGAALWVLAQLASLRAPDSLRRAGLIGSDDELGDALFDAIIDGAHGVVFASDEWESVLGKIRTPSGKIDLAIPLLLDALDELQEFETDPEFPFTLTAGERRSFTANAIFRSPSWRKKDAEGALRLSPNDASNLGVSTGDSVRVTTRRGSADAVAEVSDRMQDGYISIPNGFGLDISSPDGTSSHVGVSTNELTATEDCDPFVKTPWHKSVPARLEVLEH